MEQVVKLAFLAAFVSTIISSCNNPTCIEQKWSNAHLRGSYCFNPDSSFVEGKRFEEDGTLTDYFILVDNKAYNTHYYKGKIQMISECNVFWNDGFPSFTENGLRVAYSEDYNTKIFAEVTKNILHGKYIEKDHLGNILFGQYYNNEKEGVWRLYDNQMKLIKIERHDAKRVTTSS